MTLGRHSMGRIDGNTTAGRARHAGAQFPVRRLLIAAEEHVAMIDRGRCLQDRQDAQPTFPASATEHHVDACIFKRLQHGAVGGDVNFETQPGILILNGTSAKLPALPNVS